MLMLFNSKVTINHHGTQLITHNQIMSYGYQYFFDRLFKQRLPLTWHLGIIDNNGKEYFSPRPIWSPVFITDSHVGNVNSIPFTLYSLVYISSLFTCDDKSNVFSVISLPQVIPFNSGEHFSVRYEIYF